MGDVGLLEPTGGLVALRVEHHLGDREAEHGVGGLEAGARLGEVLEEILPHPRVLRPLAGKEKSGLGHFGFWILDWAS